MRAVRAVARVGDSLVWPVGIVRLLELAQSAHLRKRAGNEVVLFGSATGPDRGRPSLGREETAKRPSVATRPSGCQRS